MTPAPSMTRDEMVSAIWNIARPTLVPGYYVTSDDDDPIDAEFCREHASIVASDHAREIGHTAYIATLWGGADGHRPCLFGGCNLHLDLGGLTDEGVRSALGLTEEDPLACSVYPSELELAARALAPNDAHWRIWEHHARRVLKRKRPR